MRLSNRCPLTCLTHRRICAWCHNHYGFAGLPAKGGTAPKSSSPEVGWSHRSPLGGLRCGRSWPLEVGSEAIPLPAAPPAPGKGEAGQVPGLKGAAECKDAPVLRLSPRHLTLVAVSPTA